MRNLKRALSLTLASVMLLGMMVMGSSAASFPDVDDEHNVEAIEVLKAVEVMVGDDNGNFGPDDLVNRSQMAVVMANLLDLDYQYYEASCPFWDVPTWARPYVGACYANGIVSGYGDGTYGAGDTVTAVQAASMMMRALGYFQYEVDYKDGFETSTVRQGTSIGIFDDVGSSAATPMTRNQVAQMALNALQCGMVEPSDNSFSITTPDGFTVAQGRTNYVYVVARDTTVGNAINKTQATSGNANSGLTGPILDLGEQLYNGDLKLNDDDTDDFGRPARTWRLKTDEIGTFSKKSELVQSWDVKVTKNMVYEALGKGNVDNLKSSDDGAPELSYWVDGIENEIDSENIADIADRNNTGNLNNADPSDTGNGTRTELYMDKDGNVNLVVINTYVVQAASDYNESRKELRVASAGDTSDFIRLDNYTLKAEDFYPEDVLTSAKEDDYLLITVADTNNDGKYEVQTVEAAQIVTGEVTAFSNETNVSVDGERYSYATKTNKNGGVKSMVTTTGGDVALVMDNSGYIIAVDDAIVGGNYVFITEAARSVAGLSSSNIIAKAYFSDGTEDVITLKRVNGSTNKDNMVGAAGWYTYSSDSSGAYTLTSPRGSYASGYNLSVAYNDPALSGDDLLISGRPYLYEIKGGNGTTANGTVSGDSVRANERTVFVIVDKDGDVSTAVGISEAPDVEVTGGRYQIGYVWNDRSEYATFVFIGLENNASSSVTANESNEFIYILEDDEAIQDKENTYYTYKAIRDGAQTTIEAEDNGYDGWTLYTKIKTNGTTERITGMKEVVNGPASGGETSDNKWRVEQPSGNKVSCEGRTLIIGDESYLINNDTQLHMVVDKDAGLPNLKVNTDEDASYVVYADISGADLRATLDGFTITGEYYVVLEKDYVNSKNNVLDYLFLHVTSVGDSHAADETAAKNALEALDDDNLPGDIIPVGASDTEAIAALRRYIEKEIARVTKDVDVKIEWPANTGYTAPTAGTAENPDGTPGSYNGVKVTITPNDPDGDEVEVTLNFNIDGRAYEYSVEEVGGEMETEIDASELFDADADLGDSTLPGEYANTDDGKLEMMNDIADRYAEETEKILANGISPAALTGDDDADIANALLRILSNGMRLEFTWGEVAVPTQPTEEEGNSSEGTAVITSLKLVSADGEETKELAGNDGITVTVPALPFEKTEAGAADAALTAADEAIVAAAAEEDSDLYAALTVMDTETGYEKDATTIPTAAVKTAAEAVIADTTAAKGVTVKTVATSVTSAVDDETEGAFTATITLAYGKTEKEMEAIEGVITPYVDPVAKAALDEAVEAIEGMTADDLTFDNSNYTTESHDGLDTAVKSAVNDVITDKKITAEVTVTVTQAAENGVEGTPGGTNGKFSISVELTYTDEDVTATATAANESGVITTTAYAG